MANGKLSGARMRVVAAAMVVLALIIVARLVMLQVVEHQHHEAAADRLSRIETRGPRGTILDRNGFPLVTSVDRWEVHVDTRLWGQNGFQPNAASARLAYLLRAEESLVLSLAAHTDGHDALIAYVQDYIGATIYAEQLYGVTIRKTSSRRHVEGQMAAPVIGIVGRDEQGLAGLEYALDGDLRGESGLLIYEQDGLGQPIPFGARLELPYEEGADIVLTIDRNLQRIAEQALADAVERWQAAGGVIIIMDPRDGDILAVATLPTYDPEGLDLADDSFDIGVLRSRSASDVYEPGSVFKVITMAAAIDAKVVTPETTFVDTGAVVIGGRDDPELRSVLAWRADDDAAAVALAQHRVGLADRSDGGADLLPIRERVRVRRGDRCRAAGREPGAGHADRRPAMVAGAAGDELVWARHCGDAAADRAGLFGDREPAASWCARGWCGR